jgi:plastocyanin
VSKLLLVTLAALSAVAVTRAQPQPLGHVGVGASEYHFVLSRGSVKAGRVLIQLQNVGQDPHDLRLRRIGGTRTYAIPLTGPGQQRSLTVKLLPGVYRLWCSVADHAQLGMTAVLRVKRR